MESSLVFQRWETTLRLEGTALLSRLSKCARYAPNKEEQPSGLRRETEKKREERGDERTRKKENKAGWNSFGCSYAPKPGTIQHFIPPQNLWAGRTAGVDRLTVKLRN